MGTYKILLKSIVFSTRSRRRFFTFVIVFSILSGATIILLSYFDNFSREGLLEHRGVIYEASTLGSVTYDDAQGDIDPGTLGAEAVIYYKYVNFGTNLRICSIDTKYKWGFSEIKPNDLVAGNFPSGDRDALVSDQLLLLLLDAQAPVNIYTKPVVGTKFRLGRSDDTEFELRISGIFKKPESPSLIADDTREWIFIPEASFEDLLSSQNLNYDDSSDLIFIHSVSIIASGDVFSGVSYNNVDAIAANLGNLPGYDSPDFKSKTDKDEQRNMMFLSLIFGIFGTFMVSTLYSYLITRFRRREVAVLKAMGYSKMNVRIVVLSEILVVAITGFVIGLLVIQGFLWNPLGRQSSYIYLIIMSPTAFLSFLAVVISCIPGFILITTRILAVRPIEIFRQK
ncbi:MAG: ABC transporter permease [Candidatus Heimdallarchaeota archaeon]|nr:MAG: ABC transporter permease [Candidatus Heimdallarchaeota archaeon]